MLRKISKLGELAIVDSHVFPLIVRCVCIPMICYLKRHIQVIRRGQCLASNLKWTFQGCPSQVFLVCSGKFHLLRHQNTVRLDIPVISNSTKNAIDISVIIQKIHLQPSAKPIPISQLSVYKFRFAIYQVQVCYPSTAIRHRLKALYDFPQISTAAAIIDASSLGNSSTDNKHTPFPRSTFFCFPFRFALLWILRATFI